MHGAPLYISDTCPSQIRGTLISLKELFIVLGILITGQPSVLYYAASILQSAGFSAASDAANVAVVIGIFKLLMTGIAVLIVDDLGRRSSLIRGVGGIVLSLFLLVAYYKFLGGLSLVAVGALLLYVGSYQVSFGPISWVMVSEIFQLHTRGCGISLAVLTNFGSNALVTFAFSPLKLSMHGSSSGASAPSSAFFGRSVKKVTAGLSHGRISTATFKVMAADVDETKQTSSDRWAGLAYDMSDDQQDITRGKGMVNPLFQAPMGDGTHIAVLSSYDYISQGLRQYNLDNTMDGYYIAPAFMDKLVVHICKNFMDLPNIKVPLILGIWGGKGQGKSFQCELVFAKMGINPIMMSAGELESGNAGEPAKLIRQRYREAADIIAKGKLCCLFINDLDAGAGRMGGTTQYTVNNQMVNATLMNIADNPTNVQLPGMYNKQENARVPIIVTGNDFSTLYAPLIRDGRMEKFYWAPTREDRIGICAGIFRTDNLPKVDIVKLVDAFPGQSIDFFGALRARVYDDEVRKWVAKVGVENIRKKLVNSVEGPPTFEQPKMTLYKLMRYGNMLVQEQENVKRVQLADKYLSEAALGDANEDAMKTGKF